MSVHVRMSHLGIVLLALAFVIASCASRPSTPPVAGCADVASTGQLNILTLNVVYDAAARDRQRSWAEIARFAAANNVHVLLLQEMVMTISNGLNSYSVPQTVPETFSASSTA